MSEQLTLTEESYSLSIVEDNDLQLTLSGERGPAGANGAVGAAGPNTLTTATTTNLTGFISGNGTNVSGATAAATTATANTLVRRDANGGASLEYPTFGSGFQITEAGGSDTFGMRSATGDTWSMYGPDYGDFMSFSKAGVINFSPSGFSYGAGAASAHRTALGLGGADDVGFRTVAVSGTAPSNTPTAGIGLTSAAHFALFANSTVRMVVISTGATIGSGSDYAWSSLATPTNATRDLILARDAANTLAQRNGNAAQESRIYGTYTGAGDYRRLALKMSSAGVAQIVAEGLGSGAVGNVLQLPSNTTFADAPATRTALGLGTGDSPTFAMVNIGNSSLIADQDLDIRTPSGIRLVRLSRRGSNRGGISFANGSGGGYEIGFQWLSSTVVELNSGIVGATRGLKISDLEATGTVKTGGYTFANLPSPATQGMRAYITDGADIPLYMANAAGGGSTVTLVFYNGTNWINA